MKKLILSCVALMATFFCASTVSAQGVKIYKTNGDVIDVPAAELLYIEGYDAVAPEAPSFEGTWTMSKLISDREYMNTTWGGMVTFNDAYPSFDAADKLTFKDGKLIPELNSTLKNYFIGEATYELAGTYEFHAAGVMETVTVQLLKVKGVNRNFDANSKSEDDEALVGLRLVEDEEADEAGVYSLEVYILDYQATSFAAEWNDFMMYAYEKPVAATSGMPIFFSMVRK